MLRLSRPLKRPLHSLRRVSAETPSRLPHISQRSRRVAGWSVDRPAHGLLAGLCTHRCASTSSASISAPTRPREVVRDGTLPTEAVGEAETNAVPEDPEAGLQEAMRVALSLGEWKACVRAYREALRSGLSARSLSTYSLLQSALNQGGLHRQALSIHKNAIRKAGETGAGNDGSDDAMFGCYAEAVQSAIGLRDFKHVDELVAEMRERGWASRERMGFLLVNSCASLGQYNEAIQLFDELGLSLQFDHCQDAADGLIESYCATGKLRGGLRLVEDLAENGKAVMSNFKTLMRACAAEDGKHAARIGVDCVDELVAYAKASGRRLGHQSPVSSADAEAHVLSARLLLRSGLYREVLELFDDVESAMWSDETSGGSGVVQRWRHVPPPAGQLPADATSVLHAIAMQAAYSALDDARAMEIFGALGARGVRRNREHFQVALRSCQRSRDLDGGIRVMRLMEKEGFEPTPEEYGLLLDICTGMKLSMMEPILDDMKDKGVRKSLNVYGALVKACAFDYDWEAANNLLHEIASDDAVAMDGTLALNLLYVFGACKKLGLVMDVVNACRRDKLDTPAVYREALDACARARSASDVPELMNNYVACRHRILRARSSPRVGLLEQAMTDLEVFDAAMRACFEANDWRQVISLHKRRDGVFEKVLGDGVKHRAHRAQTRDRFWSESACYVICAAEKLHDADYALELYNKLESFLLRNMLANKRTDAKKNVTGFNLRVALSVPRVLESALQSAIVLRNKNEASKIVVAANSIRYSNAGGFVAGRDWATTLDRVADFDVDSIEISKR